MSKPWITVEDLEILSFDEVTGEVVIQGPCPMILTGIVKDVENEPTLMADFSDLVPTSEIELYRKGDLGSLEYEITEEGGKFFVRLEETESGELLIDRNIPYESGKQADEVLEKTLELYK